MTDLKPRGAALRYSHAVLGLAVLHQLVGSEWMAKPWRFKDASAWQIQLFELHEWTGLAASFLLLVLLWSLWRRYGADSLGRFLPWLGGAGRRALGGELRGLLDGLPRLQAPDASQTRVLAAAVEGLGLLTLLFFAATGTAMWLLEDDLELMHEIGEVHEWGALPLKLYLAGHVGMALIHEWRGEGLLRRMFRGA